MSKCIISLVVSWHPLHTNGSSSRDMLIYGGLSARFFALKSVSRLYFFMFVLIEFRDHFHAELKNFSFLRQHLQINGPADQMNCLIEHVN